MQTLVNKTPRELAREYYQGLIGFDEYRARRRELIDRITEADDEITLVPPAADPATVPETAEPDTTLPAVEKEPSDSPAPVAEQAEPASEAPAPQAKSFPVVPLAVAGVAALLVIGWLMLPGGDEEAPVESPAAVTSDVADTERVNTDQVEKLVENFVYQDDWSMASLTEFILAWGSPATTGSRNRKRCCSRSRNILACPVWQRTLASM
jgi:hypothetical protein